MIKNRAQIEANNASISGTPVPATANSSAANTTQNNNMEPIIVKLSLHTNVTMSNNGTISESAIATAQSSKGALINTRSGGWIRYNTNDDSVYADFYAVMRTTVDKLGKYNCSIWEAEMSDGTKKFLTHEEADALWDMIFLMLDISPNSSKESVKVKFDFPREYNGVDINAGVVNKWIRSGQFRSYSLHFSSTEELFRLAKVEDFGGNRNYVLRPSEKAEVHFSRSTVEFPEKYAGFTGLTFSQIHAAKRRSSVATMVANQTVIPANTAAPLQVQAATAIVDRFDSAPVAVEAPVFTGFVKGSGYADEAVAVEETVAPVVVEETAPEYPQEPVCKAPSRAGFAPVKAAQEPEEVSAEEAQVEEAPAEAVVADESVEETGSAATKAASATPHTDKRRAQNAAEKDARDAKLAAGGSLFH